MINEVVQKFLANDDSVKNTEWCRLMVTSILLEAKRVIERDEYERRANILFGQFPEVDLEKLFPGESMNKKYKLLSKSTIYIFEKARNVLIDDRISADLSITVNSLDPEKPEKKKSDRKLLVERKGIEALLADITSNNGMPPKKYGRDDFHGNIEEFDAQGLSEFNTEDVDHFMDFEWGLLQEMYLQDPLNAIFRGNQFKQKFDKYLNDILICLQNWSQVYVDEMEGAIKIEHLFPYQVRRLHATSDNDNNRDQAIIVDKSTNVRGFLRRFAGDFNFNEDWQSLLISVNGLSTAHSQQRFTGLIYGSELLLGDRNGEVINFNDLMDLPINYSYCEFKVKTSTVRRMGINEHGNFVNLDIDAAAQHVDGIEEEIRYKEDTYRAYFIETGHKSPKIIKWGKVYMQEFTGHNDEYSGFTVKGHGRVGVPVVEVLKPFHRILNVSFKMMEMLINDIKPDGLIINYSSIMKVAEYLKQAKDIPDDKKTGIDLFLQMVEESPNLLADTPEGEEGEILGGGNLGVQTKTNGLNAAAEKLQKIIDWCEYKVEKLLGTQGIDITDTGNGFKLAIENKKRTRSATAFIDTIMLSHIEGISITILNYVQDISHFKDIPAYKYLEDLIGYKSLEFIASLKKSPHRYGTFIDTFNNDITLMELKQLALSDLQNKIITLAQWAQVISFTNLKKAISFLEKQRMKAEKKKQQEAMGLLKQQDQIAANRHKEAIALEELKGRHRAAAEAQRAAGFINAANINAAASIRTTEMGQAGQNQRVAAEAVNEVNKIAEESTQLAQKSAL